jgi:hypothetical protein
MSNSTLLSTASKIFGLYFCVLAALDFRDLIFTVVFAIASPSRHDSDWVTIFGPMFSFLFNVGAAWFLIARADQISKRLGASKVEAISTSVTKTDTAEVAIIVVGFIAMLYGVPVIFQKLISYAYFNEFQDEDRRYFWDNRDTAAMIYYVFQSVAGLFVLLNARHFARKFDKLSDREEARL